MSKTKQILEILNAFDPLYENFYPWLAGQYDSSYGGFYYAVSAKSSPEFQPDIESTGQAVHILDNSNLISQMPEAMKNQIIAFFHQRQTPEGYFFDFHTNMRNIERMAGRAISYSCTALEMLGSQPWYSLPGSGENRDTLPEHCKSLAALRKWLDERPWHHAWGACDHIQASSVYLRAMPEAEAAQYVEFVCNYLLEHQDPQTGLWGAVGRMLSFPVHLNWHCSTIISVNQCPGRSFYIKAYWILCTTIFPKIYAGPAIPCSCCWY